MDLRCAAASLADDEPLAGSAPTDRRWLFLEQPGPWGRKALRESRLPESARAHLAGLRDVRVQLLRRPGARAPLPGEVTPARVVVAHLDDGEAPRVWSATLPSADAVTGVDPHDPEGSGLLLHRDDAEPLWLVCTNGSRDLCCAELGRPVAAALAARWPEGTWETTHLGGHRFSGTLLALPSGLALGRVGADDAVAVAEAVMAGALPPGRVRGRAGRSAPEQVAELAARERLGLTHDVPLAVSREELPPPLAEGQAEGQAEAQAGARAGAGAEAQAEGQRAVLRVVDPGGAFAATVHLSSTVAPRLGSCGDARAKPATSWHADHVRLDRGGETC
ncbi:sucrase ferredoxin [Nocardioides kribbensis]|uniref:Sucrase ferredoxin n=1 Tax=Nocardioides kribbensis TaxID=305517 RepID=A0ABV1P2M6_9ACTN